MIVDFGRKEEEFAVRSLQKSTIKNQQSSIQLMRSEPANESAEGPRAAPSLSTNLRLLLFKKKNFLQEATEVDHWRAFQARHGLSPVVARLSAVRASD